ncbi:MAG: hypothetical protein ACLUAO_01320 [Streptococcus sp.]
MTSDKKLAAVHDWHHLKQDDVALLLGMGNLGYGSPNTKSFTTML